MRSPPTPASSARRDRLGRPIGADRIGRVIALHRVIGQRQIGACSAPTARDDPGWRRTENCRRASAARRSASARTMPQNDAGTRIDPLVSDPSASGTSPPPTALPDPPDDPPVMRAVSCGLRDGPSCDVLAGEVVGVFAHVQRADQDRAGRFQPRDQRRVGVGGRMVAVDLRSGAASAARRRRSGSSPRTARPPAAPPALPAHRSPRRSRLRAPGPRCGHGGEGVQHRVHRARSAPAPPRYIDRGRGDRCPVGAPTDWRRHDRWPSVERRSCPEHRRRIQHRRAASTPAPLPHDPARSPDACAPPAAIRGFISMPEQRRAGIDQGVQSGFVHCQVLRISCAARRASRRDA